LSYYSIIPTVLVVLASLLEPIPPIPPEAAAQDGFYCLIS